MDFEVIKFEDKGQDFAEWTIRDGFVVDCQPFQSSVWVGREAMLDGDIVFVRDGDEGVPINYRVISVDSVSDHYSQGFADGKSKQKNDSLYQALEQYRFGFNVAVNFDAKLKERADRVATEK